MLEVEKHENSLRIFYLTFDSTLLSLRLTVCRVHAQRTANQIESKREIKNFNTISHIND